MKKITALSFFFLFIILASQVAAQTDSTNSATTAPSRKESFKTRMDAKEQKMEDKAASREAKVAARLDAAKLRVCKAKQAGITRRSKNANQRAERMIGVFDKIAARVQEYYNNKLIPQGKIVSNYDSLVLSVNGSRDAAVATLTKASLDLQSFSCDGENPGESLKTYNASVKNVAGAIKQYKTAVRELIVAVKSVVGQSVSLNPVTVEDTAAGIPITQ